MANFVNFIGGAYQAQSRTQDMQRLINWYPEVDPAKRQGYGQFEGITGIEGERGIIALYPTPGLTKKVTPAYGQVRALHTLPGGATLLAIVGAAVFSISSAWAATQIGTLTTGNGRAYITDNGASAYITDGSGTRYYYTWATNTFAQINDGPFTGGSVCGFLDNYMFYNEPGTRQWGCTDAGTVTSNALNLGSKIAGSDNLVSVWADHQQVLLLGERESERWSDTGGFPFPYSVLPGSAIQHGVQAPGSIARLGEGIAYLALDDRGQATVVLWGAAIGTPQRISTYAIENYIQSYKVTSDAIGYSYAQSGHEFYVLTFPSADVTWVYDISTGYWHRRAWRDQYNVLHRHRSNCCAVFNNDIVVGDWENGNIYTLDQSNYTDAGDPIPCVRRAPHLTSDLRRQFFSNLQVQFEPAPGLQVGQGSDPTCVLRWSDDGGFTFGNDHTIKLGKVGQYLRRAKKRRLGFARDRVFEIEMTDPVWRAVVSATLDVTPGAN